MAAKRGVVDEPSICMTGADDCAGLHYEIARPPGTQNVPCALPPDTGDCISQAKCFRPRALLTE